MRFIAIALSSGLLTAVLLVGRPGPPVGAVAGLFALWLLPGYALQAAVLPQGRSGMRWPERLVISAALSLALLAAISVVYDALGNRLTAPAVIVIACGATQAACLAGLAVSILSRRPLLRRTFQLPPGSWIVPVAAVAIVIVGGLSVLAWKPPPRSDLYVELSILDELGKAPLIPLRIRPDEPYSFTIRVASHGVLSSEYVLGVEGPDRIQVIGPQRFVLGPAESTDVWIVVVWTASRDALTVTLAKDGVADYRTLRLRVALAR